MLLPHGDSLLALVNVLDVNGQQQVGEALLQQAKHAGHISTGLMKAVHMPPRTDAVVQCTAWGDKRQNGLR